MGFPIRGARGAPLASARVIPVWLVCLLVKAACAMTRCVQVGRLGVSWDPGLVSLVQRWAMMRLKMRMIIEEEDDDDEDGDDDDTTFAGGRQVMTGASSSPSPRRR